MPVPTIISDVFAPHWATLADQQKTCWHFFALTHPVTNKRGHLRVLTDFQMFYKVNVYLGVTDDAAILDDPPADFTPPSLEGFHAPAPQNWRIKHRTAAGVTERHPKIKVHLNQPFPLGMYGIVQQTYTQNHGGPPITGHSTSPFAYAPPSPRHVTIIKPGDSGDVDLLTPTGYFASTGGRPKFSHIRGIAQTWRPADPSAKVILVSAANGAISRVTIPRARGAHQSRAQRPHHFP